MTRQYIYILILILTLGACSKLHKKAYYSKVDSDKTSRYQEGYHSHEANRLIDYKNKKRENIEKKQEKKQEKIATQLNEANKTKKFVAKRKKKMKFDFYM
jgi:hypothetical protein